MEAKGDWAMVVSRAKSRASRWLVALPVVLAAVSSGPAMAGTQQQKCPPQTIEQLRRVWQIAPDDEVLDSACKPWPDDERLLLTLTVFGFEEQSGGQRGATLALAIVEARSFRVVSRHREAIGEDASFEIRPNVFTLDTARYRLAPGVRGFGVVSAMVNRASCPDGGLDAGWRLYVAEGPAIRQITDTDLYLHTWRYTDSRECRSSILHETNVTLDVRSRPGGWADLVIKAHRSDRKSPMLIIVPYDGLQYPVGKASERIGEFNWQP
jgi:hypothetical protein